MPTWRFPFRAIAPLRAVPLASAPKLSTGSAFGADKHKEDDGDDQPAAPSVDAIQKVLTKIQDTDKPEDLEKSLDKDIDTLTHNEATVPAKVKEEFTSSVRN
ncbi:hypothetical protein C8259_02360 [Nocardia nova]|uniref:Uncharacterized protein n=2 Tax=Nocardiaceae TaxID=85025 RepID=A0A2T2ZEJ3_9NOCA|nr:hypothetical protein C8259_02360 [Nocardia nova]